MKFLVIRSRGLMDSKAISLIGASTKRDDASKIGQFGSGLNYSIASLVKQNYAFYIFSGEDEIKIGTQNVSFGGKDFEQITVDGQPTSLTTTMGHDDWDKAYPFIREIWCNALDSDEDAVIEIVDNFKPAAGFTQYVIEATPDVMDIYNNLHDYFVNESDSLHKIERLGSFLERREGAVIFRKGIRAWVFEDCANGSVFSYDLFHVGINESRVLNNPYEAYRYIAEMIELCSDKQILKKIFESLSGGNSGFLEHECVLDTWVTRDGSQEFIEYISSNDYYPVELSDDLDHDDMIGRIGLPLKFLKRFLKYNDKIDILGLTSGSSEYGYKEVAPTTNFFDMVEDAKEILMSGKYAERMKIKVKFVSFFGGRDAYRLEGDSLLLSSALESTGQDRLAGLILEQNELCILGGNDVPQITLSNQITNLLIRSLKRR